MAVLLISYEVFDSEGKSARIPTFYNESIVDTLEKADNIVQVVGPRIAGISDCRVRTAYVTYPIVVGADDDTFAAGARVDAGATLSFRNSSGRAHSLYVPGFPVSLLEDGKVNASDSNMADFISSIIAGGGITGNYQAADGNELDLTAYIRGFQSTRKTRR
jgi:hypothetical protein